jgi:uncharacterized protein (TIGR02594 family)
VSVSSYVTADPKHPRIVTFGSPKTVVREVQRALIATGAVLVVDGEFGPITESAVKRFQGSEELNVVGYVGPKTAAALDRYLDNPLTPPPTPKPQPLAEKAPWVAKIRAMTGVKEIPGAPSSPTIMSWKQTIARRFPDMANYVNKYTNDGIAWCGYFLGYCFADVDIAPPYGSSDTLRFIYAKSWKAPNWGTKLSNPIPGCIMTFSRTGGGHVAMLEKLDGNYCYIRGGNQQDLVNVVRKSMNTFYGATWPKGWAQVQVKGITTNAVDAGSEA